MSDKVSYDPSQHSWQLHTWDTRRGPVPLYYDPEKYGPYLHVCERDGVVKEVISHMISGLPPDLNYFLPDQVSSRLSQTYPQFNPTSNDSYSVHVQSILAGGMLNPRDFAQQLSNSNNPQPLFDINSVFYQPVSIPTISLAAKMNERGDEKFKILSIDGGGIRGIIPLKVLEALERIIGPMHETFDLIGGTSTGGLIGLGLSKPQPLTAGQMLNIYANRPREIFTPNVHPWIHQAVAKVISGFGIEQANALKALSNSPMYTNVGITNVTHGIFGHAVMKDALTNVLIPSVNISDPKNPQSWLFNNLDREHALYAMQDVAQATSAAPTYFPHKFISGSIFIDGGLVHNNPGLACAQYAQRHGVAFDKQHLLSLGTGYADIEGLGNETHSLLYWAKNLFPIVERTTQFHVKEMLTQTLGDRYVRIDPAISKEIPLDSISRDSIDELLDIGSALVEANQDVLRRVAQSLRPDRIDS